MPSGKVAKPDITDNKDGTVTVKYAPTEAGLHEMDIKYDGIHIPGKTSLCCLWLKEPYYRLSTEVLLIFGPCQQAGQNMMLFTSVYYDYIYSTEDIIWLVYVVH